MKSPASSTSRAPAFSRGKRGSAWAWAGTAAIAKKLGAHFFIDAGAVNPAEALTKLGGAQVILSTAPSGKAISPLVDGLGRRGELIVVGASPEAIEVTPLQLIGNARTVRGW